MFFPETLNRGQFGTSGIRGLYPTSCEEPEPLLRLVEQLSRNALAFDENLEFRHQSPLGPRSPLPIVPLAISSIRSRLFLAARRRLSSISIRGSRSRSAV